MKEMKEGRPQGKGKKYTRERKDGYKRKEGRLQGKGRKATR